MGNSCIQTQNVSKVQGDFSVQNHGRHIQIDQKQQEQNQNNLEFDRFFSQKVMEKVCADSNFSHTVLDETDGTTIPKINNSRNPQFIQRSIQMESISQMDQIYLLSKYQPVEKSNIAKIKIEKTLRIEKTFNESNKHILIISNRIIQTKIKLQRKVKHQSRSSSARIIPILKKSPRNLSLSSSSSSYKKVRFQEQRFFSDKFGRI